MAIGAPPWAEPMMARSSARVGCGTTSDDALATASASTLATSARFCFERCATVSSQDMSWMAVIFSKATEEWYAPRRFSSIVESDGRMRSSDSFVTCTRNVSARA